MSSVGAERLLITMLYGTAVAAVLLLAALSRSIVLQKLALILLASWMLTNLAFAAMGVNAFPAAYPTIEAGMAAIVATIGLANRSHIALAVFCLYGLMIVTHVVAIGGGFTQLYAYKAMINVSFIGQLLVVGGPSAWMAILHLSGPVPERSSRVPARR